MPYVGFELLVESIFLMVLPIVYMSIMSRISHNIDIIQEFKVHNLSISLKVRKRLRKRTLTICGAEISFKDKVSKNWIIHILQSIEQMFTTDSQRFTFEISINLKKSSIKGYLLLFKDTKSDALIEEIEAILFQKLEKFLSSIQEQNKKISYKISTGTELTSIIFDLLKLKKGILKSVDGNKGYLKIINEKGISKYFTLFKKLNCRKIEDVRHVILKIFDSSSIDEITFILSNKFTRENRKLFSGIRFMQLTTIVEGAISRKRQKEIGTTIKGIFLKKRIFDLAMRNLFFRLGRVNLEKGSAIITEAINESLNRFCKNKEDPVENEYSQLESKIKIKKFVWVGCPPRELLEGCMEIKRVGIGNLLRFNLSPNIIYAIFGALFNHGAVGEREKKDVSSKYFKILKNVFFRTASLSRFRTEGVLYVLRQLLSDPNYLSEEERIFVRMIIQWINNNQIIVVRKNDNYLIYDISAFMKTRFNSYKLFVCLFNLLLIGVDYDVKKSFNNNIRRLAEVYYVDRLSDISPTVLRYLLYSRNKKILTKRNKRNFEYIKKIVDFPFLVNIKRENRAQGYFIISRKNVKVSQEHSIHERSKERRKYKDSQFSDRYKKQASINQSVSVNQDIIKLQECMLEHIQKNGVVSWEEIYNKFTRNLTNLEMAISLLTQNNTIHMTKVYFDDFSTTLFFSNDLYISPIEAYMMKKFSEICNEMGIIIDTSPYLKSVVVIEEFLVVFFKDSIKKNSLLENLLFVKSKGYNKVLLLTPSSEILSFSQINTILSDLGIDLEVLPFNYQKIYSFLKNLVKEKKTLQKV